MANDNQFIQEDVLFPQATKRGAEAKDNWSDLLNDDVGTVVLFSPPPFSSGGVLEDLSMDENEGYLSGNDDVVEEPLFISTQTVEDSYIENDEVGEEALFTGEPIKPVVENLSPVEELDDLLPEVERAPVVDEEVLFTKKEEPIFISDSIDSAPSIMSDELAALSSDAGELDVTGLQSSAYIEKNFAQKFLEAEDIILKRYDELKNYILLYKGIKSRVSNDFDSFNMGRTQLFKLGYSSQSLKLYLNLDYSTVEPRFKCKDVSHKKAYAQVPVFLRIKSDRAMKNAKHLIQQVVERFNLQEDPKAIYVDSIEILKERAKTYN